MTLKAMKMRKWNDVLCACVVYIYIYICLIVTYLVRADNKIKNSSHFKHRIYFSSLANNLLVRL